MPRSKLTYALIAYDLSRLQALLYRHSETVPDLHTLLDIALRRGARVISIRVIHPIPEPKGDS